MKRLPTPGMRDGGAAWLGPESAVLSTALALALATQTAAARAPQLEPKTAEWAEVEKSVFAQAWRLPEAIWRAPDGSNDARLLPIALKTLVERDFRAALPAAERDVEWCGNFGDIAAELRRRGGKRAALKAMLDELRASRPALMREIEPTLVQLFQSEGLASSKWKPGSERDDDGMLFDKPIEMRAASTAPWKSHKGSRKLQQAAAFLFADLEALKAAENDFPAIFEERGARYDFIGPVAGSLLVGEDGEHGPFAAHRVRFRYDLPFPFSHFDCTLSVATELDREKHVTTFIYSDSKDCLWLAGRDFLLPVRTSSGEWCGTLIVRLYGFDLEGVPDGDDDRAASLRGSLGNLKRRAEASFRDYGGPPRTVDGAIPKFAVLGELKK